jgi:AcrR family transcriptional regulator
MTHMKNTIKAVAIDLFHKKGYFATSISDITRGCGIQKASMYHHFPAKEDLLYAIMQQTMADLMTELKTALADETAIEGRMRAATCSHIRFHLERQKETFIASSELRGLSPDHYARVVAQRDEYEHVFQQLIRAGMQEKVFAQNDVKILSYAILTLCTAGAAWYKPGGRLNADAIASIYEEFILNGLKGRSQLHACRPVELACEPLPF